MPTVCRGSGGESYLSSAVIGSKVDHAKDALRFGRARALLAPALSKTDPWMSAYPCAAWAGGWTERSRKWKRRCGRREEKSQKQRHLRSAHPSTLRSTPILAFPVPGERIQTAFPGRGASGLSATPSQRGQCPFGRAEKCRRGPTVPQVRRLTCFPNALYCRDFLCMARDVQSACGDRSAATALYARLTERWIALGGGRSGDGSC